jgi:hypothetical protein
MDKLIKIQRQHLGENHFIYSPRTADSTSELGYFISKEQLEDALIHAIRLTHAGHAVASAKNKVLNSLGVE